ncbi:Na(+)/H(+) antiporter subunit F1 [Virgibacillus sp. NKC19-16]|uniref:Na(+)/H(+) antiporter subunit F1 n=1 Tax=Virgibacillus salidurans TaxID=2831673 RepID=UPI001F1DBFD2|nr:Na(+)/H(+) antiporter subunit F1 [Virgibacillus sp. NKC19-16]UJL44912.1 Na(+)/H(+) antiporter subunit F1 [Virgibacillus sp. NKC19-16]
MFLFIQYTALVIMAISLIICFIRTIIGPTTPDRVLALDSFGINLIGFIGVVMILQETIAYSDVVLVLSILAFISTVTVSKFIERGTIIERD